jgi:hypothetical protein
MAGPNSTPSRNSVSVKTDAAKGMPLTSVQGGQVNNTPKRTAVGSARTPQRTPAGMPVHQMRDSGSASAQGGNTVSKLGRGVD